MKEILKVPIINVLQNNQNDVHQADSDQPAHPPNSDRCFLCALTVYLKIKVFFKQTAKVLIRYEQCYDKSCLWDFRSGPKQTWLYENLDLESRGIVLYM